MPITPTRRTFIKKTAATLAGTVASSALLSCESPQEEAPVETSMIPLYIGTYTRKDSQGIYRALFNTETGALSELTLAAATDNPSYLALHPQGTHLYAVHEVTEFDGMASGAISSFSIDAYGGLTKINTQITRGGAPCYVSVDNQGQWVFIANYVGGNVALFPIDERGLVQKASDFVQHEGQSVNTQRQQGPHAHCILPGPSGTHAYAVDLGIDKIMIYAIDKEQGRLMANDPPFASTEPGAGPRHFVFHPNGRHAFVINELNSTISSFDLDATTGGLTTLHTTSTLPADYEGASTCADIHVHPNGQFVYGSNRGHDSIAIMAFDDQTGSLTLLGNQPTQGQTPRNFALDPTGQFLLAANQQSDSINTFRIDANSGLLTPTDYSLEAPTPVCLKFM